MNESNESNENSENSTDSSTVPERVTRKLATIQVVAELNPIVGADRIETASILGWKVVVKKGEFKVGDKCVYFEIDSLLPNVEWSKFLDKKGDGKPIRLKTVRLKGQVSQGLALPLNVFSGGPEAGSPVGYDVTDLLKVEKYEPYIPANLRGVAKGGFPSFLHKTDELRIQAYPDVINEFKGKDVVVTLKMDGTSFTSYRRGNEVGVCSRNLELVENPDNAYWKIVLDKGLKEKMLDVGRDLSCSVDFAFQAELCGPGIQGNRMGLKEIDLFLFNAFDIGRDKYLGNHNLKLWADVLGVRTVPVVYVGPWKWETVEELLAFADEQNYDNHSSGNDSPAEGVVIRPLHEVFSPTLGGRLSIKAISNRYLMKYGE
jgi:RNA ligase (TIGR02306 family)